MNISAESTMQASSVTTAEGLKVSVRQEPVVGLEDIYSRIDRQRGAIFSSGFDYPGRHSRWDIGFINPALEFTSKERSFSFRAFNAQGEALLPVFSEALTDASEIKSLTLEQGCLSGSLAKPEAFFAEEERSRQASIFSILRRVISLFKSDAEELLHFGFYGAFGYDLVTQFENLKLRLPRDPEQPDCRLYLPLELVVIDRKREISASYKYSVLTPGGETAELPGGGETFEPVAAQGTAEITADHEPGEFAKKVEQVIKGAERGDYFEVVLSQSFKTRFEGSATSLFKRLAGLNPSPYMFLLNFGSEQLVGASPELFVRVTGKRYETCPIAGTVARGETALEDADQVRRLIASRKDEAELTMCTDVDRNDMARVCVPGSVRIIGRRQLEFYSHLIHTVDHLEGELEEQFDGLDAFQTHMWACTVTGAPKPAALQAIEDLENSPRNWYSGAIGFLGFNGDVNTGITLRTAVLKDGRATLRAGATLLFGSDPQAEEQETRTKAAAFLAALAAEEKDETREETTAPRRIFPRISAKRKVLLVDCKDSFVHNLASYLRELGAEVVTVRSGFPLELLDKVKPHIAFLSPGPGSPEEFGVPSLIGSLLERKLPIFGVCLGHQGIGQYFGAELAQLPVPEHGRASRITHTGTALFKDVTNPFEAGRYHSLYLKAESVPDCLSITAETQRTTESGEVEVIPMAIEHKTEPVAAVQFHPESLMTLKKMTGHLLLRNALEKLT